MRQGWKQLAVLALALASVVTPMEAGVANAATKPASGTKSRVALHQFTGVVTAVDKTSLTVEKTGKAGRTMQFTKHAAMTSTGEIEKEARVTVYYRDEDGHPTAHRVVVRTPTER